MTVMEDLDVYKLAYPLVLKVYKVTATYPDNEKFGLVSQMRRAAVSIVSNLSEGGARITDGEQRQFIGNARGSLVELRAQVRISEDIGFISENDSTDILNDIERIKMMMNGLLKTIK
ncbi:MAG: four helix bundle protein [Proteobacteria bacterium]|nr:four helix bundle protein [Pseudomonadota bacterium]